MTDNPIGQQETSEDTPQKQAPHGKSMVPDFVKEEWRLLKKDVRWLVSRENRRFTFAGLIGILSLLIAIKGNHDSAIANRENAVANRENAIANREIISSIVSLRANTKGIETKFDDMLPSVLKSHDVFLSKINEAVREAGVQLSSVCQTESKKITDEFETMKKDVLVASGAIVEATDNLGCKLETLPEKLLKMIDDTNVVFLEKVEKMKREAEAKVDAANERAADAEKRAAVAETKEKMERERRMGIEAMIKAGAPLRFPLEDHERNDKAQQQESVPSSPVSSQTIPKRTTEEILRDVVWRWCLECELGIESKSGKLLGEVTGLPRTGFRVSLQGCPLYEPNFVSLYGPGYVPPFGAFRRDYPYNSLSPTEKTRVIRAFREGKSDGSPWWWEEWWKFRTSADAKKNELGIPPYHTFSLPRDALPPHEERLNQRFMLSQTLVTQELWESVMVDNPSPSRFKGTNRPVENVSWEECKAFIDKLNDEMREKLGVPPGYEFALPLERQWEHACRAGTSTPFHVGLVLDAEQANIGKLIGETSEVGKYPANPWGLYDMHGNVWEWCYDGLGYGPLFVQGRESVADGFYRSLRGGSWSLAAEQSRSAYRSSGNPKMINDITGKMLRAEMRPTRDGDIEKMVGASMVRGEGDIGFRLCLVAVQPLTFP